MAAPAPVPLTAQDIWNEALAVVPMVHTPVLATQQHALIIGNAAIPAAILALRYPAFADVATFTDSLPSGLATDRRIRQLSTLNDLAPVWKADLVAIAESRLTDDMLQQVREHTGPASVIVVAVPQPTLTRPLMDVLRQSWRVVQPYREHTPDPAYFLLVGDQPFRRQRPIPGFTRRISDKYIPALFTFAKDEYATLFGGAA